MRKWSKGKTDFLDIVGERESLSTIFPRHRPFFSCAVAQRLLADAKMPNELSSRLGSLHVHWTVFDVEHDVGSIPRRIQFTL